MTVAKTNNIKKGKEIIEEINAVVRRWNEFASHANVREDLMNRIEDNLHTL